MKSFKVWWPDCGGETVDDAIEITAFDTRHAATEAADHDYSERSGWERGDEDEQLIAVQSPEGDVLAFRVNREWDPSFYICEELNADETTAAIAKAATGGVS